MPSTDVGLLFSNDFLWSPKRPSKTQEEIAIMMAQPATDAVAAHFCFDDRLAVRALLYTVIDDTHLRELLDGFLVPPPYFSEDFRTTRWTSANIQAIVDRIPPSLDGFVVLLPFNFSLQLGVYDARLRAACRRLCWVLNVPFAVVATREQKLSRWYASHRHSHAEINAAKQEIVSKQRTERKMAVTRVATIGGFAALGGAVLLLTGGLAAPLVAPAYAALLSAATATVGTIGAVGGAVFGTGAVAAVFTGALGLATHASALAALLTPVLTVANVTAIFGIGGVGLAGYKAYNRTDDSSVFAIRSVHEVEALPSMAAASDIIVRSLAEAGQAVSDRSCGTSWDLTDVLEDTSVPGVAVPSRTRHIVMNNVACLDVVKKRHRHLVCAIDCGLPDYVMRLKAIKLTCGIWALAPVPTLRSGEAGVCACINRYARPTGTGFVMCYGVVPERGTAGAAAVRVWFRVHVPLAGSTEYSALCESISKPFDVIAVEARLEKDAVSKAFTKIQEGVVLDLRTEPRPVLALYPATKEDVHSSCISFEYDRLPQRQADMWRAVRERRKIGVALANHSIHTILVKELHMVNGVQWPQSPAPAQVDPGYAALMFFTNSDWSLEGAEGFVLLELRNEHEAPLTPRYCVRLQFEVSALNRINVSVATAPSTMQLRLLPLRPSPVPVSKRIDVPLPEGLFCTMEVRVVDEQHVVELHVHDFIERPAACDADDQQPALTIAVGGFSSMFDSRRRAQDQQLGLWAPFLPRVPLFEPSECYVLHWADDRLKSFGKSICSDFQVTDIIAKQAVSQVKSVARQQLLTGALFAGFRAFRSFTGSFALPLYAVWAFDVIDNNFSALVNRAVYTGKDLAAALLDPLRGHRPVSLVGFSFGSRVIAECLKELYRVKALALVENVYLLGSTVAADLLLWQQMRCVTAGRLVNVYTRSDWTLWMMFRIHGTSLKPMAGVHPVNLPGVENVDVTPLVKEHAEYATKLEDILRAIPLQTTSETWQSIHTHGSPGVVVPVRQCERTVQTVAESISPLLSFSPFCSVGLRNCIATSLTQWQPSMEYIASDLFNCYFDFLPPSPIQPGKAGVFGLVADGDEPMGGIFSFVVSLHPHSAQNILLLVWFYCASMNQVRTAVQTQAVHRQPTTGKDCEETHERHRFLTTNAADDLEAVRAVCEASTAVEKNRSVNYSHELHIPFDSYFCDGQQQAIFRFHCDFVDGGFVMSTAALLVPSSSRLQREQFSSAVFDMTYATVSETEAMTSPVLVPVVAEIHNIDDMHHILRGFAKTQSQKSLDDVAKPSITPIVLVNCSEQSFYFNTDAFASCGCTQVEDPLGSGELGWVRFPPPELPPRSFTIIIVTGFESAAFPRLQYETSNADCTFWLTSAVPFEGTRQIRCQCAPTIAEATVSTHTFDDISFHVTLLSVKREEHTGLVATGGTHGKEAATVHVMDMHSRGWYVV